MDEETARAVVCHEARRLRWLFVALLPVIAAGYMATQSWWSDRTLRESAVSALIWLAFFGPFMWFVFTPAWVRRRSTAVERATVSSVDGQDVTLTAPGQHPLRIAVPRHARGFRAGDEVWLSPGLEAGIGVAVLVPDHVTSRRPVVGATTWAV